MAQGQPSFRAKQIAASAGSFVLALAVLALWLLPQLNGENQGSGENLKPMFNAWGSLVLLTPVLAILWRWNTQRRLEEKYREREPMGLVAELKIIALVGCSAISVPLFWQSTGGAQATLHQIVNPPSLVFVVGLSYFCMFISNRGHVLRSLYPVRQSPALHLNHHLKAGSVWLIAGFWGYIVGMGQILEAPLKSVEVSGLMAGSSIALLVVLYGLLGYFYHLTSRGWLFRQSHQDESYVASMGPLLATLFLVMLSPLLWFTKLLLVTDIDLASESALVELFKQTLHLDNPDLWVNFIYSTVISGGLGLAGFIALALIGTRIILSLASPKRTAPESFWVELTLVTGAIFICASQVILTRAATIPVEAVAAGVALIILGLLLILAVALCWVYLITLGRWLDAGIAYVILGKPSLWNHFTAFFIGMLTLGISSSFSDDMLHSPYTWVAAGSVLVILLASYLQRSKLYKVIAAQTEELEQDKIALEALDQQKTHFFQTVSHELRTPLTLILTPLERTLKEYPGHQEIETASSNARRLLRLVNQLLDFQKLSANRYELSLEARDLVPIVNRCADYFRSAASGRDLEFSVTVNGNPITSSARPVVASIDVDAFEKVAMNYLSNALKYTPPGGSIELGLMTFKKIARLKIVDTGPGIALDQQAHLFEIFTQVDGSTTREFEGTGIGLALCKELTEGMAGHVGVESSPGAGSTFWASFPLSDTEAVAEEHQTSDKAWVLADGQTHGESEEETQVLPKSERGHATVLVVDDNADMRAMVKRSLEDRGYHVLTASDGQHGLERALEIEPDIIVSDWMMPRLSGPELVTALRKNASLSGTPIILLTAKSDDASKLIGTDLGADAFLGKPFNEAELSSTVRNLLQLKSGEKEIQRLNRYLTESVCKRYLPPDLIQEILDGSLSMDKPAELKDITVLFTDLKGFTATSETLGATEIASLLNEYLTVMNDIIFEHGGTIDKFIGDAIMVMFGAPKDMDVTLQAERATACASAMQKAMISMTPNWESRGASHLAMRIGIHQGPAVVGNFGSDRRSDYTCIGPTVNLAARIESSAEPGQVFLSDSVRRHLASESTEAAGKFSMKGVSEEQTLYRIKN